MSPQAKEEYFEVLFKRYKEAGREEKTKIIDECCKVCGYHRKHAIRRLRGYKRFTKPRKKRRGKPTVYNKEAVIRPLKQIWLTANLPCSKRLKAALPVWLPKYNEHFGQQAEEVIRALLTISPATIDRILKPVRVQYQKRGKSTTKPGTLLRKQIPINTNQWEEWRPGFLEADTVAHCGDSTLGMYANTVNFTDIATGWTEQRAVWGKGETGVLEQIKDVENRLPFPLLGFDSDNGGEFLNYHLQRHFADCKQLVYFTRSRAYHKNDNAHIEQKNWTHVRQWLGYQRLDNPKVVPLMNSLYRHEWRFFHNYFLPSVKLIEKERIGSKTIKKHDNPKTPYQRIMESQYIPKTTKDALTKQLELLNPFELRNIMEMKLKKITRLR
ncbi:MAG: integrase [Deltaproteobacteria bacterium]